MLLRDRLCPDDRLTSDAIFDSVYDENIQALSALHWTPVDVARRAAAILVEEGATRVLDVGSGVGKFCIVGALSTDAEFVGIERRASLVNIARHAADAMGAASARFVHADLTTTFFDGFDGVYLYNPFYEQVARYLRPIDSHLEYSFATYCRFVDDTVGKLAAMKGPAVVVTFNGFGGAVPRTYSLLRREPAGGDHLEVWRKR